jgi:hypothetical protein
MNKINKILGETRWKEKWAIWQKTKYLFYL